MVVGVMVSTGYGKRLLAWLPKRDELRMQKLCSQGTGQCVDEILLCGRHSAEHFGESQKLRLTQVFSLLLQRLDCRHGIK